MNDSDKQRRNLIILKKIREFTKAMTKEPGAAERCRAYLKTLEDDT